MSFLWPFLDSFHTASAYCLFYHVESPLCPLPMYAKSSSGVLIHCEHLHLLRAVRNDSNVRRRELTLIFEFRTFHTSTDGKMHSLTAEGMAFGIETNCSRSRALGRPEGKVLDSSRNSFAGSKKPDIQM